MCIIQKISVFLEFCLPEYFLFDLKNLVTWFFWCSQYNFLTGYTVYRTPSTFMHSVRIIFIWVQQALSCFVCQNKKYTWVHLKLSCFLYLNRYTSKLIKTYIEKLVVSFELSKKLLGFIYRVRIQIISESISSCRDNIDHFINAEYIVFN